MEEFAFLGSRQESIVDELKLKIRYTALELSAVKAKANEELNKNTESLKQLFYLLKLVYQERDEARDQIHQLLQYKINMPPSINMNPVIPGSFVIDQVHQINQNPLINPAKANSSIEESNSLSDAYNHSSSPVDSSLFDPVTSPDFNNINTKNTFFQMDLDTLMMEGMIKGKVLPPKGKLLQAVMEAGPLLQTLFVSDPFTSWQKTPPPPLQYFCNGGNQNQMTRLMMMKQSQPCFEMPCGGGSILSFINNNNDANLSHNQGAGLFEKRQRFQ